MSPLRPFVMLASVAGALICVAAAQAPAVSLPVEIDEFKRDVVRLDKEGFSLQFGGSLVLCEGDVARNTTSCVNGISDVVTFNEEGNVASMFSEKDSDEFPSGIEVPGDTVADLALLAQQSPPSLFKPEKVSENRNEFFEYTPNVGDPGFALVDETPVSYEINSDRELVPEPSSILMLNLGFVSLILKYKVGIKGTVKRQTPPRRSSSSSGPASRFADRFAPASRTPDSGQLRSLKTRR